MPRKPSISSAVVSLHLGVGDDGHWDRLLLAALMFIFAAIILQSPRVTDK